MTIRTFGARTPSAGIRYGLILVVVLLSLSACAGRIGQTTFKSSDSTSTSTPVRAASSSSTILLAAAPRENAPEEPFDPFAKPGEEGIEEYDPWEPFNSKIFEFNRQVDRWVLKPVAKGYNFIVPNLVQVGVSNFFYNTRFTPRFFNNVFQGKIKGAGIEVGRFLINTTVGIAGFFDVAQHLNLKTPEEDTGQTLGFYGIKPGPYVVLPFLPPYTVRDFIGYLGDIALNPIYWLVTPIIEVRHIPSVIPHKNRMTTSLILITARGTEIVNDRSLNLEKFQGVEESTLDLYAAVRNAYLQKRANAIQE